MKRMKCQDGATAVEYSIMVAAIAAVIVAVVLAIGSATCNRIKGTNDNFVAEAGGEASSCS